MLSSTSNLPKSDDERKFREELITDILDFRSSGNKKLGELVQDLYDATSDEEDEIITNEQKFIDQLCELISDPANNRTQIIAFLSSHDIDINIPHSEMELRPIDLAAQSGSLDSFQFLFEDCQAEICGAPNVDINIMTLIPSDNKAKMDYFIQHEMWTKMKDGTTELFVAAWAGNLDKVRQLVEENPVSIFHLNDSDETVLDWADVANNENIKSYLFQKISIINTEATAKSEWHVLRDMYLWYGIRYGYLKEHDKILDYFNAALDAHEKATVDNSIDIKNLIYRKKSKACAYISADIVGRYDPSFKIIEVEEVVDYADVMFKNKCIKVGRIKQKMELAIIFYKESMKSINCISNKEIIDLGLFMTHRSSLTHIYMILGLLYSETGDMFCVAEMYEQTLEAYGSSKVFFNHALNIASNGTVFNDCADIFGVGVPDVFKPLIEKAKEMLRAMDQKIARCRLEINKNDKPRSEPTATMTAMGHFTLWGPEHKIVEEKPDDMMEEERAGWVP